MGSHSEENRWHLRRSIARDKERGCEIIDSGGSDAVQGAEISEPDIITLEYLTNHYKYFGKHNSNSNIHVCVRYPFTHDYFHAHGSIYFDSFDATLYMDKSLPKLDALLGLGGEYLPQPLQSYVVRKLTSSEFAALKLFIFPVWL